MLESRNRAILIFFYVIGIIYIARLFYLQVVDPKYRSIDSTNAIRKEITIPMRGQIYDRNHRHLVMNEEVYDMYVTPNKVKNIDTTFFCNVFHIERSFFDSTMAVAQDFSKRRSSLFLRGLTKEEFARAADVMVNFKGFHFELSFFRNYPDKTLANALGYIAEIPKNQYDAQTDRYYRKGDYIGLTGLEKSYENELRGVRGVRYTLMNVKGEDKGRYENGAKDTLAIAGHDLYSTIDLDLQLLADSLFQNKAGAVVAIEPKTGEILVMGSYPTYDPNLLAGKEFSKNYGMLLKNPDKPTFNRTISSFYRPGSTFKLLQSVVALQLGVINPNTSLAGSWSPMKCHGHGPGHMINITRAVQFSCNPYFYNVFKRIIADTNEKNPFLGARQGLTQWRNIVERFGFGTHLGIDIPGEKEQLLPNLDLYDKYYGKDQWKFSNIASLSIGEGELGLDVLKLANLAATIANKGYWLTPHLIRGIGADKQGVKSDLLKVHQTGVDPQHFLAIYEGMELVVKAGTARRAYIPDIPILGKTGTSENRKGRDHAVFIAFAPRENPQIAIAAVVENAGFGGSSAGPISSLIIEKYIRGYITRKGMVSAIADQKFTTVAGSK